MDPQQLTDLAIHGPGFHIRIRQFRLIKDKITNPKRLNSKSNLIKQIPICPISLLCQDGHSCPISTLKVLIRSP